MAVTPPAQIPELLNFDMFMLNVIFDWKTCRIIYSNITTEPEEDAGNFVGK
jgi:hypothetical protein